MEVVLFTWLKFVHKSSSWVELRLHAEFQLPRLCEDGIVYNVNRAYIIYMAESSSCVELGLHAQFQLPKLHKSRIVILFRM